MNCIHSRQSLLRSVRISQPKRLFLSASRSYSSEAVAGDTAAEFNEPAPAPPKEAPKNILSALILSRIPIVTPELTPFEKSYYNYQNELERRLMLTFPSYFYFKRGTLAERNFVAAQTGPVTRQPGVFYPKGLPDIRFNRDRRSKQEIVIPRTSEESDAADSFSRPITENPRKTDADVKNDTTSLIRKLDRTLYLVVKSDNHWKFPAFELLPREPLHEAAERGLRQVGGNGMSTWVVSNTPAAVYKRADGLKEFFIKSHILHGEFKPASSKAKEFAWLTKEELSEKVDKDYFSQLSVLLSDI